jgi:tetratricopeptide (TPR) repeat protein
MRFFAVAILAAVGLQAQTANPCPAGSEQFKKQDYTAAQASLWDCVESGVASSADALDLALTYRTLKNYDSGLSRAAADLKRSPDNVNLLYLAAFLQYRLNDSKDSMVLVSKAYKIQPNDWRLHQLFALNYIVFRMPDAVESELKTAIRLNPENSELHYQLGRLFFSEEHVEQSIEEINRAIQLTPDYPQAYDSLGLSYESQANFTKAAESYLKAIALNRKLGLRDEWPLIDYGSMLLRQDSAQAAVPYLLEALEINPLSANANYQAGRAMRLLKRYDEAQKYFEKTIALDPSYSYAYYQLANLVRERGDNQRASLLMSKYKELIDRETGSGTYNPSSSAHTAR